MKLNFSSFAVRIPLIGALTMILISGLITYESYRGASTALEKAAAERLGGTLDTRAGQVSSWFRTLGDDVKAMRDDPATIQALEGFSAGWHGLKDPGADLKRGYMTDNPNPTGKKDMLDDAGDGSAWSQAHKAFHGYFRELKNLRGYYDIFLFDAQGNLVYTVFKEPDFATNLMTGPYAKSGLGRVYRAALQQKEGGLAFADFSAYAPSNGAPAAFLATRVAGPDGKLLGVVAVQLPVDRLEAMAEDPAGLGKTGHVTLVGPDGRRRNADREHRGDGGAGTLFSPTRKTAAVTAALAGKSGVVENGIGLVGSGASLVAYRPIDVMGAHWAIIAEQGRAELMAAAVALRNRQLAIMAIAALVAVASGLVIARRITGPLKSVGAAMDRIAARDYTFDVPFQDRGDETGALARNIEEVRAELQANEAAERLALFRAKAFSNATAALMMVDRDLNIIDYNQALRQLFEDNIEVLRENWPDFEPENLVGVNIDRFHRDPDHQRRLLSDPANLPYTADIVLGELRLQLNIEAIIDDAGDFVGTTLQWNDVGEARINSAIMQALRRNQTMIEYDSEFRLHKFNEKFTEVFGWAEDAVGKSFEELFGPNEDTRIAMERLRGGLSVTRKVLRPTKTVQTVAVEVVMNPIFNRQGELDRIVEIGSDVTRLEVARLQAEGEAQDQAMMQQRVVDELRRGLSALAEGDLAVSLDTPFAAEYDEVRRDFNAARANLETLVAQLTDSSSKINSGASRIAKASDDLSRRTESQAATLEETSAALHKMSDSLRATASGAAEADRAVRDARTDAEASGKVMNQAVGAMGEIQNSSSQIVKIIAVIDNIAFQTNLLALNAGVEAARAGEAGRGFALVASEVRDLAQRSSEAAKEIEALISASSGHVDHGVRLVAQAGELLQNVLGAVSNLSTLVSDIASAQEEQSGGLSEISAGANALSDVVQRNATMVDQSTSESHALREQAEQLAAQVARFRLARDSGGNIVSIDSGPAAASGDISDYASWGG